MPRYFLEVSYKGTHYSGFQTQHNANTIQAEIEKAFAVLQRHQTILTGSSRTDAGVHALQNFFHFDYEPVLHPHFVYKVNAILPDDIVVKSISPVIADAHCRFDAISREYNYYIYQQKNPFLKDRAFFFPYQLDIDKMQEAAAIVKEYTDFTSFSKRNTQVKSFDCNIIESKWLFQDNCLVYNVKGNRFLRGMVRALTATILKVGRNKLSLDEFRVIIQAKDCTKASFAVPAHGLFLMKVEYPKMR
ncbi:MAG: tRNA pseudouridine(38-40) synthase TruA [Chitinophagaceae bacterium]|jgi:tRNA pseudouridine38-40 synthase|nr:tRNA pseudouridine(38-40) synthase TruA [Chitinophagaceae bacterium]MBK7678969.1 tRNA pseudouridine(38-40) synthase TruA [Chitinophagaceae bacterium]MBK9463736.1 tRNA pseudouridine(38-40) synthase TruA [Chitinophagaceae bacterium]MBK9659147.1 tRNA pseudouridine(38-40) synthase TruA [Chitinophagaceae bacterium]MBK9937331.1 tRNA pseudouridine(38-40) synthase TruA [Chitinophagaceae bacterium]